MSHSALLARRNFRLVSSATPVGVAASRLLSKASFSLKASSARLRWVMSSDTLTK